MEAENKFEVAVDELMRVFIMQNSYFDLAIAIGTSAKAFWQFFKEWTEDELGERIDPYRLPTEVFLKSVEKHTKLLLSDTTVHDPQIKLSEHHKQTLLAWKHARKYYDIARGWAPLVFGFTVGSLISNLLDFIFLD